MNIIEKRRLRDLRESFDGAPVHIKQTRWYKTAKVRLDRIGDPGPEPPDKTFTVPEGCPLPELADGADYCKDCKTPVEGCTGYEPPEEDPALAAEGEEAERAEHEGKEQEEADRETELQHEGGEGPP